MRICSAATVLLLAASASAQNYGSTPGGGTSGPNSFQMRLIADGDAGAPTGPGTVYNLGDPAAVTVTRVGFWLQARVAQTANENWGIVRASMPSTGHTSSYIVAADPVGGSEMSRGSVNGANTNFGRGSGYRNGGTPSGQTGNPADSAPFPGSVNNENGALDNGGSGSLMTRVYGIDSYVGSTRTPVNPDNPTQPWRVNGASNGGSEESGMPVPSDGTFSPWANLYRVWIDISNFSARDITVSASALLNGAIQAVETEESLQLWAMQVDVNHGVVAGASYMFHVPAPGATAVLALGGAAAMRRRRTARRSSP